jgi:H+/Cl- antiporter ClcA
VNAATTGSSAAGGLAASAQTIFTGAAVGRLYGQMMHLASPDVATQPCGPPHATKPAGAFDLQAGLRTLRRPIECSYALMGACALLGGIQRATIALVVIMLEGAQCNALHCRACSNAIRHIRSKLARTRPHALSKWES